ncbi:hypothetical protein WS7_21405 [Xanthomonas citri pv. malvacearum str. GSPB2388]|uniref:DUF3800 domain-containing protein n=1 Tax=Xanthomonas citri TaxID=346 RepID=UPI000297E956|nr:DUF3800 domain-containing protein [Xanthomonas citri]EKQ58377.1 hypothetical protein WS7_21405 [Xanthomonas citri pv. malvacearum str. GSPB2388]
MRFYLDESGHTGDTVHSGRDFDFSGQLYFVLAAVGVRDQAQFEQGITALRERHQLGAQELKSSELIRHDAFIFELVEWLCAIDSPILVEVVDKRFYVCIFLVISTLMRNDYNHCDPVQSYLLNNRVADALYEHASDSVLNSFIEACKSPSDHALMTVLGGLYRTLIIEPIVALSAEERLLKEIAIEAGIRYHSARQDDADAFFDFLPRPDFGKRHQAVWMLPNQTSLANIYARINMLLGKNLQGIEIRHDEQQQYAKILLESLKQAERAGLHSGLPLTPNSDFLFIEKIELAFENSTQSLGIQVADLIAGSVMRFYRSRRNGTSISEIQMRTINKILSLTTPSKPVGINQVLPTPHCIMPR